MASPRDATVSFLFLGETLLIPHLYPVVEALAALAPTLSIELWVSTSMHETLLGRWLAQAGLHRVEIRRAPGFRVSSGLDPGDNPPLPMKLPMLARLAPTLAKNRIVVCAEQTSLWVPTVLPLSSRFVMIEHGVGGVRYARSMRRRRSAWKIAVASNAEQRSFIERGLDPNRVVPVGYVKHDFHYRTDPAALFPSLRPIVVYNPHWQRHRSSWWDWGAGIVESLIAQDRFNVILAPHQRLVEGAPEVKSILAEAARHPHVHADFSSFATVDGSYTAAADIYLGDTSSQAVEFIARPRPCVFLNNGQADWRASDSYPFWTCGEVIDRLAEVLPAVDRAVDRHERYRAAQQRLADETIGNAHGAAARVAEIILEALA